VTEVRLSVLPCRKAHQAILAVSQFPRRWLTFSLALSPPVPKFRRHHSRCSHHEALLLPDSPGPCPAVADAARHLHIARSLAGEHFKMRRS